MTQRPSFRWSHGLTRFKDIELNTDKQELTITCPKQYSHGLPRYRYNMADS